MKKVKKTKQLEDKMQTESAEVSADLTREDNINKIGLEVKRRLDQHFKQWGGGLSFRTVMSNNSYKARNLGLEVGELAQLLEDKGYIKVINTPSGARFLFSSECPLSNDELADWLMTQELQKSADKA